MVKAATIITGRTRTKVDCGNQNPLKEEKKNDGNSKAGEKPRKRQIYFQQTENSLATESQSNSEIFRTSPPLINHRSTPTLPKYVPN